jgi:hypothetical protein
LIWRTDVANVGPAVWEMLIAPCFSFINATPRSTQSLHKSQIVQIIFDGLFGGEIGANRESKNG